MTTGRKFLQTNSRERAVSSDLNRLQVFAAATANDFSRGQLLRPVDDTAYVGTTLLPPGPFNTAAIDIDAPSAPLYGVVIDGLMVLVPAAGTGFIITPGQALVIDPDGEAGSSDPNPPNPDDSIAKLVQSPGSAVAADLPWTPNPGPGLRIDVIEMQRFEEVAETDNRDIFNPSTGLFSPASVTKVTIGGFTYRVRQGVAGGGLPAAARGWMPLAVVATPAGAVDLDTCTIWDVRWLASDMADPNSAVRPFDSRTIRRKWFNDQRTAPGKLRLSGQSIANYIGFKTGGLFWEMSNPGQQYIDLNSPFYRATGFVPVAGAPYFVYAVWPGNYVRWVRYYQTPTTSQGGRTPGAFRGIPTVSHIPPLLGVPVVPVAPSASWGLSASTQNARLVASGVVDSGGVLRGGVDDGDLVHLQWKDDLGNPYSVVLAALPGGNLADWTLIPGVHFPAGCNRILANVTLMFTALPTKGDNFVLNETFDLYNPTVAQSYLQVRGESKTVIQTDSIPGAVVHNTTVELPVGGDGLSITGALVFRGGFTGLNGNVAAPTLTAAGLAIIGWDSP